MKMKRVYLTSLAVSALMLAMSGGQATAANNGANKVHVTGSTALAIGPGVVTLASTSVKTSDKADLLIEFNGVCRLGQTDHDSSFLSVSTVAVDSFGDSDSDSDVSFDSFNQVVQVWVEIDGNPVPIDPSAAVLDNGRINFCAQAHNSQTFKTLALGSNVNSSSSSSTSTNCSVGVGFDSFGGGHTHPCTAFSTTTTNTSTTVFTDIQQQQFSDTVEETANANSFRWFAFDLGAGHHTVEVKAALSGSSFSSDGGNSITTVVGRRTTVVSPLNNLQ